MRPVLRRCTIVHPAWTRGEEPFAGCSHTRRHESSMGRRCAELTTASPSRYVRRAAGAAPPGRATPPLPMAEYGFWNLAQQDPSHLALVTPDEELTAGELHARANRVTHGLRAL